MYKYINGKSVWCVGLDLRTNSRLNINCNGKSFIVFRDKNLYNVFFIYL